MKDRESRPIDRLLHIYSENHQNRLNKITHWFCIPAVFFGLLGLLWCIPFPTLSFLGVYNGYLNWASFAIAFSVYYYYRLSPVFSYLMLLFIFVMSFGIVGLEKWESNGGPSVWLICMLIFGIASASQFAAHKVEREGRRFFVDVKFLLIGPLWLMHLVCKELGLKY